MIFLIAYIVGYVWLWRYHVGYILDGTTYGDDIDGADFAFSLFFGTFACLAWPLTLAGRGVFVLWQKNMSDDTSVLSNFFPPVPEIETKQEKRERLARAAAEQVEARRREINEHERANGLELTRWVG